MHESCEEKLSVLNLSATLSNGKLCTDPHIKAADCHSYHKHTLSHPDHTKKSQFLVRCYV